MKCTNQNRYTYKGELELPTDARSVWMQPISLETAALVRTKGVFACVLTRLNVHALVIITAGDVIGVQDESHVAEATIAAFCIVAELMTSTWLLEALVRICRAYL